MSLPQTPLDEQLLYMFVIGPGRGESVLLRVPPDQWIVVDSLKIDNRPAAEAIVKKYGGTLSAIVLTHPHADHYPGVLELIEDNPEAVIGCVHPKQGTQGPNVPNDPLALLKQNAKRTYDRIWQEWEKSDARKWITFRGASLPVGADALLTSLHPQSPLTGDDWKRSINEISSAMWLAWHDVRLLLGADVTNTSWPEIASVFDGLNDHQAMKVPHHGSNEAIHESYGSGSPDRVWIATPFASGRRLPRAEDGNGIELILNHVSELNLTSLPYSHDCETQAPCSTTRQNVAANTRPQMTGSASSVSSINRAKRVIAIAYDRKAQLIDKWFDEGTLVIS